MNAAVTLSPSSLATSILADTVTRPNLSTDRRSLFTCCLHVRNQLRYVAGGSQMITMKIASIMQPGKHRHHILRHRPNLVPNLWFLRRQSPGLQLEPCNGCDF